MNPPNPRIETKEAFTLLGMGRDFSLGSSSAQIPLFWQEFFQKGHGETLKGMYGVCVGTDNDDSAFRYYIADSCAAGAPVPKGFEKVTLPALTWVVLEGRGKIPEALQRLNRYLYEEWLPTNGTYAYGAPLSVELYDCGGTQGEDFRFEIWQAVRKGK